jgi:predicted transcriptional regulator
MAKEQKTDAIVVRVSPELKEALQKLADADDRKLSDYVRIQLQKMVGKTAKS